MEFEPFIKFKSYQEHIDYSFEIRQKNNNYILNITANDEYLILKISEENMFLEYFEKILNISDIQNMHKTFIDFSLFQKFVDYIKSQIDNNKLEILKINKTSILIRLKQENVEIILKKKKLDNETIIINICKEMKRHKKNIEQKFEKIISENIKVNQEIEELKSLNTEVKKENEEIKANIKQLKEENKNLKEANKDFEEKLEKFKKIYEEKKLIQFKNPNTSNTNSNIKRKKLNLDIKINNNINNILNKNEDTKSFNSKKILLLNRMKPFSNRCYTLRNLNRKKLDIIKEDTEQNEQADSKKIIKKIKLKDIIEEKSFNDIEDKVVNSLNININKIFRLDNNDTDNRNNDNSNNNKDNNNENNNNDNNSKNDNNNNKKLRNTLSYNEQSIKQLFNRRISRKRNEFNLSKNNTDILTNNTFINLKKSSIKNLFGNLTDKKKFNTIKKIRTKDNYNNKKIINNSMNTRINEMNKNNQKELNQNFINTTKGCYHKKFYFNNPNYPNRNSKKIQIDEYNSKYRTITNLYRPNSNKIFNNIYKEINNQNENKIENKQHINCENAIIKIRNIFKLNLKNNLKNYANVIINVKGFPFVNPILQSIANVERLIKYFLSEEEEIRTNKIQKPFSNAFLEMIENLWENKFIKEYTPINLINLILNQANQFLDNSKELISFILDNLHKELNEGKDIIPSFENLFNDNLDKYFQNFEKYFNENFKSIITDLFYLKYDSQITCFECNNISHFINFSNILEFSLEDIKECNNINKKNITINDCFKYYQRQDFVYNKKCNKCNQEQIMGNIKILLTGPKLLIISINVKNDKDNKLKVEEVINLNEFIYYKEKKYNYELISLITYLENDNFITFCKSFVDKNWYKYCESKVFPCSFNETNIVGTPYLLFYSLIENQN